MKPFLYLLLLSIAVPLFAQPLSDKDQIRSCSTPILMAFTKAMPTNSSKFSNLRLYKFGYLKNKDTENYEYYEHMGYKQAIAFVEKMKKEGRSRDETTIRNVEVLDIANHIASAKVTAAWGVDFVLLSKDNKQWMIEAGTMGRPL